MSELNAEAIAMQFGSEPARRGTREEPKTLTLEQRDETVPSSPEGIVEWLRRRPLGDGRPDLTLFDVLAWFNRERMKVLARALEAGLVEVQHRYQPTDGAAVAALIKAIAGGRRDRRSGKWEMSATVKTTVAGMTFAFYGE